MVGLPMVIAHASCTFISAPGVPLNCAALPVFLCAHCRLYKESFGDYNTVTDPTVAAGDHLTRRILIGSPDIGGMSPSTGKAVFGKVN